MSTEFLETYNNESFQLAEVNAKIRAIEQDMIFVKDTEKDEKSKLEKLHIYNQRLLSYERKKETLEMKKCIDTLKGFLFKICLKSFFFKNFVSKC
jgi:lipase chaperone LimK